MIKRFSIHLIVQLGVLIAVGAMAGFTAIILMGGIGGTAMGIAPEFIFGMVGDIVCPEGTLEYYSQQRSYHEPGESEPHVECVSDNGVHEDVLIPAIFGVLGVTFLAAFSVVFLPVFIPLAIVAFIVTSKLISGQEAGFGPAWK